MAKKEADCQCKKGEHVLLVEGKNDCHVIMHLCKQHQLPQTLFCTYDCNGDENLLLELERRLKEDLQLRPKVIGIVLDADIPENKPDIMARWQQLMDKLQKYGYCLPSHWPCVLCFL